MSNTLEISWTGGQSEALTSANVRLEQKVRPLAQQAENESFKVWQHVRKSLATADFTAAGQHKKLVDNHVLIFHILSIAVHISVWCFRSKISRGR